MIAMNKKYRKTLVYFVQAKTFFIEYWLENDYCDRRVRIKADTLTDASKERFINISMNGPANRIIF
jgi:hypothetical protein